MLIKAKKSLGQNFLRSEAALSSIVECSEIKTSDTVIEIGPGEGVLTEKLLNTGAKVIAIEKDDRLIEILKEKFNAQLSEGKFVLIHADVTEVDLNKLATNYKVVANIPYYITGLIMRRLVDDNKAESLTLLVQREVAERGCRRDGKESLLSLSLSSYGEAKYIKTVPRGSFVPAPNVDSAIIYIKKYSKNVFKNENEKIHFFELIHAGFAHKRKTLLHNLNIYKKETGREIKWEQYIDEKVRAEDVHFDTWLQLVHDTI
jgi:16S rRNA (adenine1518-N6/adenine1519-N6)-dimethyltransferase